MNEGIGDRFQKETKYTRETVGGGPLRWDLKPDTYKRYPDAPRTALDPPHKTEGVSLWQVLRKRRSVRSFQPVSLAKEHLSQLIWACQGITHSSQGFAFRTAPSAGALYPIETYLAVHGVEEISPGLYHYAVETHELELLKSGDFRLPVARSALDQDMAYAASAVFIWTAVFERSKWKYRQRAYRYVYLDAGHIAAHLSLASTALGLGSCQIAALYDDEVNELLGIDGELESVLYMSVVGRPL